MLKIPEINVSENAKKKLSVAIKNALEHARDDAYQEKLFFKNGRGLHNLNYLFTEIKNISDDEFIAIPAKRSCYEFCFVYDKPSRTLIAFTSKQNLYRLKNRTNIQNLHYIDSCIMYNDDYEGDCNQMSLFETTDNAVSEKDRIELRDKLINRNDIDQFIICEYDILHALFQINSIDLVLISSNFNQLKSESLRIEIQGIVIEDQLNPMLKEEKDKLQNEPRLAIKIKQKVKNN